MPDYVSINLIEGDSTEMIDLALSKGIGVEAGIWSAVDAEKFAIHPAARRCLRVLIEINEQDLATAMRAYRDVVDVLDRAGILLPRLLHGLDATMWDFWRKALAQKLDGRIGLEDGKHLPSGTMADGNAALIRAARALAA